jgi:hypothetical protein
MRQSLTLILHAAAMVIVAALVLSPSPASAQSTPSAQSAQQDPCVGVKAAITIDQQGVEDGAIKATGTWQVSGGASGVLIEPRVDADRWQSETYPGTSGTWVFDQKYKWNKCGHYAVRVYAYPSVSMNGHLYHCLDNESSLPWRFNVPCAPKAEIMHCDWDCGEGEDGKQCAGTCVGSATEGTPPYLPFWGLNDRDYKPGEQASMGPWTEVVRCAPGDKVSFKVRHLGGTGKGSQAVFLACGAEAGKP